MELLVDRCCGLDVHKKTVVACVRAPGPDGGRRQEVRTFATFTSEAGGHGRLAGRRGGHHRGHGVHRRLLVAGVVRAGGTRRFSLLLVNARHAHNVPGRKTDVADAAWLAQLVECGLLRGSFVPEPGFRRLRDLTRYRRRLVETRTRESHRLTKVLEDAGIKLDSVASKTLTVSGRRMIEALVRRRAGPRGAGRPGHAPDAVQDPPACARPWWGDSTSTTPSCAGCTWVGSTTSRQAMRTIDRNIEALIEPMAHHRQRLCTIPGVANRTAEVILAEIGTDMARFPTAGHLASWAGMCPGNNESAGKHRSGRTRPGNPWLRAALTQAAWVVARGDDTYLRARFWRIAGRRGKKKAAVAVGHSILVAAFHILRDEVDYQDLGADWFSRHDDVEARRRWLLRQLEALDQAEALTTATS